MRPRYAREEDLPEVKALLCASPLSDGWIAEHVTQYMVSRDNAGILGCVGIDRYETTVVIRALAIAQRARSAGLGELLMSAVVADVRRSGIESIVLHTTTAVNYFASLGFRTIDARDLPQSVSHVCASGHAWSEVGTLMEATL